jgi:hypothetical protein
MRIRRIVGCDQFSRLGLTIFCANQHRSAKICCVEKRLVRHASRSILDIVNRAIEAVYSGGCEGAGRPYDEKGAPFKALSLSRAILRSKSVRRCRLEAEPIRSRATEGD